MVQNIFVCLCNKASLLERVSGVAFISSMMWLITSANVISYISICDSTPHVQFTQLCLQALHTHLDVSLSNQHGVWSGRGQLEHKRVSEQSSSVISVYLLPSGGTELLMFLQFLGLLLPDQQTL